MKNDTILGIFIIILGVLAVSLSTSTFGSLSCGTSKYDSLHGDYFPRLIGFLLIISGSILSIGSIFFKDKQSSNLMVSKQKRKNIFPEGLAVKLLIFTYVLLIGRLKFFLTTFLILPLLIYFFGEKKWKSAIITGVVVTIIYSIVFIQMIKIPLPTFR